MSAQGATLGRGTVRLPMWPVAAIVAAAAAVTIGITMIDGAGRDATKPFELSDRTVIVGISHVAPSLHATRPVGYSGLENPGGYIPQTSTYPSGLENPAAYGQAASVGMAQGGVAPEVETTPTVTWHRPEM